MRGDLAVDFSMKRNAMRVTAGWRCEKAGQDIGEGGEGHGLKSSRGAKAAHEPTAPAKRPAVDKVLSKSPAAANPTQVVGK
jgi:hypothetical protein